MSVECTPFWREVLKGASLNPGKSTLKSAVTLVMGGNALEGSSNQNNEASGTALYRPLHATVLLLILVSS